MKRLKLTFLATAMAVALSTTSASAQFFTDGLDDLTSWTVALQTDASAAVVDYGLLGIPEAPNMVGGSGATTGVRFDANTDATPGAAAGNLIGAISGGNADLALSVFELQFDVWVNVGVPVPTGGTEQLLWGIGRTTTTAFGRNNRAADGDGIWGWLAGENGYGTEDAAIFDGSTELADLGDTQAGEAMPFNAAFTTNLGGNDVPANSWVTVKISANNGEVITSYNDVIFFRESGLTTLGDVMVGYEDPFSSISLDPANQFGIIDNVYIDDMVTIPEPTSLALFAMGSLAMLWRRK
ncbi:MAG: PEP-CTERM sorting domain-containing protein [Planctomycetota bacterium]